MLQIRGLTKCYGDFKALKGIDLDVKTGEVFCLLGQNGAGKSTTINIVLGFMPSDGGTVEINGIAVSGGGLRTRQMVAYIPEVVMLYGRLSAIENLDYFSRLAGFRYSRTELESFLQEADLQDAAFDKYVGSFSKGMRQKVGIAIAVAKNADLLLMDEPTSGLDPRATEEFSVLVKNLAKRGKAVLIATHDIFNAAAIGTQIGIMRAGELVHVRSAKEVTAEEVLKLYLETV